MDFWDKVATPPASVLKKITGGRLKNMTDIKPMWRIKRMTEVYGLCGIDWKYQIKNMRQIDVDNEIVIFVDVDLSVKIDGEWSDAIPGVGGSKLKVQESSGPHISDEAYKMAVTDALTNAMKMLGVGADVYMGYWDGSKYTKPDDDIKTITEEQEANIVVLLEDSKADLSKFLKCFQIISIKDLKSNDYERAVVMLEKKKRMMVAQNDNV